MGPWVKPEEDKMDSEARDDGRMGVVGWGRGRYVGVDMGICV